MSVATFQVLMFNVCHMYMYVAMRLNIHINYIVCRCSQVTSELSTAREEVSSLSQTVTDKNQELEVNYYQRHTYVHVYTCTQPLLLIFAVDCRHFVNVFDK